MLEGYSKLLGQSGIKYWDFRKGLGRSNSCVAWNGEIKEISSGERSGHSFRVLFGNAWGFVYSEKDDTKETITKAIRIAKALNNEIKVSRKIFTQDPIKDNKKTNYKINPDSISIEKKRDLVLEMSNAKNLKDSLRKNLDMLQAMYLDSVRNIIFINSEGSEISQELVHTYCGATAVVKSDRIETYDKRRGHLGGFEVTKNMNVLVEEAVQKANQLLTSEVPKGGAYPVVCDGVLTDVFIHEALGHAAEADTYLQKESCLEGFEGKSIAKDFVNVFDSPLVENGWGSFFYDDEGIPAQKTQLIKNGVLNSFMHSRETAAMLNAKPTGNARAEDIGHMPVVRMSNTYIGTGSYDKEELFEGIKYGFYLLGSKGGQVDTAKGNFQFSAQEGFLIEKGKLTKPLREVSLAGITLEILSNITKISNEYEEGFPGFCGKNGQRVPVIGNNPSILIKKATVGGR